MEDPNRSEKARLLREIRELERIDKELERKYCRPQLNAKQREACNQKDAHEWLVSGGNQIGKSTIGIEYVHAQATGKYPDWWEGVRFDGPIRAIVAGESALTIRDVMTDRLFGSIAKPWDRIFDKSDIVNITTMGGAIRGAIDYADVKHYGPDGVCDGISRIFFRSYSQKWDRLMGFSGINLVWVDEEPADFKVYEELSARLNETGGYMLITFTPLRGYTKLYKHFNDCRTGARQIIYYSINDVEHFSKEKLTALRKKYAGTHMEETRLHGRPTVGEGLIYPFLTQCIVERPDVPESWGWLIGLDFNHTPTGTFAALKAAVSPDLTDVVVTQEYKQSGLPTASYANAVIRMGGAHIPVCWPHDGGRGMGMGQGKTIKETYAELGLNMRPKHAMIRETDYQGNVIKRGSTQLQLVTQMGFDLMSECRLRISTACPQLIEEMRSYRAENGVVVLKQDDHLIDAMHKILMSLQYSRTEEGVQNAAKIITEQEFFR